MIKLSIIIPIYNSEKYLKECLDSIVNQNYKNYEVILIDDGSKDSSAEICKKYVSANSNFKYYYQTNSGVSAARNFGISKSKGEYIYFMDSDDKIVKETFDYIINNIKNYDLLCFGYTKWYKKNLVDMSFDEKIRDIDNFRCQIFTNPRIGGYLWNKLFKREIIVKYNINFDQRVNYSEDLHFVIRYLNFCSSISYKPKILYYYRFRKSNVSANFNYNKNKSILLVYKDLFDYFLPVKNEKIIGIIKKQYNYYYYYFGIEKKKDYEENLINKALIQDKSKFINSLSVQEKLKILFVNNFPEIFRFVKKIKSFNNNYFD